MPKHFNPFNIHLLEYLCSRLSNIEPDKFRLLNTAERLAISTKSKLTNFVRKTNLFSVLSVLTKIGVNWGIYIIDEDFEIEKYPEIIKSGDYKVNIHSIGKTLKTQKSFLTSSKQFALLQNIMANSCHGDSNVYDNRFIKISSLVNKQTKEIFDSYNLMNPEVESRKATGGSLIMVSIMRNLPTLITACNDNNLTLQEFILLNEFYYKSDRYISKDEIENSFGKTYTKYTRKLTDMRLIFDMGNSYNISTNGIILIGDLMKRLLNCVDFEK